MTTSKDAPVVDITTSALADLGLKDEVVPPVIPPVVEPVVPPVVEPVKPAEFEIELSANSPLEESDLDEIVAIAEKYKWDKEQTDAYIKQKEDVYNRGSRDLMTKAEETIRNEKAKFAADPDFQGAKLIESLNTMDEVIKKYGGDELRTYLKGPGGNSLPLAKLLLKIGNVMKQDTFVGKGVGTQVKDNSVESSLKQMYPSFFPDK